MKVFVYCERVVCQIERDVSVVLSEYLKVDLGITKSNVSLVRFLVDFPQSPRHYENPFKRDRHTEPNQEAAPTKHPIQ